MSKMIQVRNVPAKLHKQLVRRARARGTTLTQYIQSILEREVARPDPLEVFDRISHREPIKAGPTSAELIRKERAARGSK